MSVNGDRPVTTGQPLVHQALLCHSDAEFLASAAPFVKDGIAQGERVLVGLDETKASLVQAELGNDADEAEFIDPHHWYRAPSWAMAAYGRYVEEHRHRFSRVRVLGEIPWSGRPDAEITELRRCESLGNLIFVNTPASFLCTYDVRQLDQWVVDEARRTHPELLVTGVAQASPHYVSPLDYSAECDRLPLDEPASTLDERPITRDTLARARQMVHLEARRVGLGPERAEEFIMAVSEIAGNALQHGSGSCYLRLWHEDRKLVCEVTNEHGYIDDPFPGHQRPDTASRGGRGLWVVRQLCELVQIRSHQGGGCTVRLHAFLT